MKKKISQNILLNQSATKNKFLFLKLIGINNLLKNVFCLENLKLEALKV